MFDNTRNAIEITKRDLKNLAFYSTLVIQLIFVLYHTFSLIIEQGIPLVHSLLLAFSGAYLVVCLATHKRELEKTEKEKFKLAFKTSKYIINFSSLVISLIWLANNPDGLTVITIVPVVTLLISIMIQFICEFLSFIFVRYSNLYVQAIDADTRLIQEIYDTAVKAREGIGKVKGFYDEHKDNIKGIAGSVLNTISMFKKPHKAQPHSYEDKTDDEYSTNT